MNVNREEPSSPRPGLPPHARLVFKGVIFEIWQWEQEMFDGSIKTFEKSWRPPTIEVVPVLDGKILIGKQEQPTHGTFIALFGGRPESDDIETEAKRELLEETGCVSDDWYLLSKTSRKGHTLHDTYVFIARNCRKVQEQRLDSGEKIDLEAITFENFLHLPEQEGVWITEDLIKHLRTVRDDPAMKEEFHNLLFPSK